jgi:hypothetical protein
MADMPPPREKTPQGRPTEGAAPEGADLDLACLDSGFIPPSAARCRITDLQQWIDLCA